MQTPKPYIDDQGEVRELDEAFFKNATKGMPPKPRVIIELELDADLAAHLSAEDDPNQTANTLLRKALVG